MTAKYTVMIAAFTLDSTNNVIRIDEDAGTIFDVTLTAGTYFFYDNGTDTAADAFANELETQLDAESIASGNSWTYSVFFNGIVEPGLNAVNVVIQASGGDFEIVGSASQNTFDLGILGFADGVDTGQSSLMSLSSTLTPSHAWVSNQPATSPDPRTPPEQTGVSQHVTPGGQRYTFMHGTELDRWLERQANVSDDRVWAHAAAADSDEPRAFESFWTIANDGRQVRIYRGTPSGNTLPTLTASDLRGTFVFNESALREMPTPREVDFSRLFDFELGLVEYKA